MSISERFGKLQHDNESSNNNIKRTVSVTIPRESTTRDTFRTTSSRGVTKPRRASHEEPTRRTRGSNGNTRGGGTYGSTSERSTRGSTRGSTGRGRGTGRGRRGRGRGRGGDRKRTPGDLDKDLQSYMLSDPEKGKDLLDQDLEEYMKNRDSNSSNSSAAASTTTESKNA